MVVGSSRDLLPPGKRPQQPAPEKSLLKRLSGPSDNKAGLKRDPEEVQKIIYEASKGGKYFLNEKRKDEELSRKVDKLVKWLEHEKGKRKSLKLEERRADELANTLEATRDLSQTIMVVDADAFYASVEELHDPSLVGTAFVVGKGVVTTASYEARKYGCRSAMPEFIARKLCPGIKSIPLDFARYTKCSKAIMAVLAQYDAKMSPASLDEAYMNITEYCRKHSLTPAQAAERIRAHVKKDTGLTVSAGVAPNAMLAKIAADFNKPDGQYVIDPTRQACMAFMRDLPVRKVPGIGRVTERWLTSVGINKVGDVWALRGQVYLVKDAIGLTFILRAYLGLGRTQIERAGRENRKSVGREDTFGDISRPDDLYAKLREIAEHLNKDLVHHEYSGRTITLKVKLNTYEVLTRAHTVGKSTYISKTEDLYREGKRLLDAEIKKRHRDFDAGAKVKGCQGGRELVLRLMGLKMSNLRDDKGKKPAKKASPAREKKKASTTITILDSDEEEDLDAEIEDLAKEASQARHDESGDQKWEDEDANVEDDEGADFEDEEEYDAMATENKPFWTAGESLNSKAEVKTAATVPESDQLNFEGDERMTCPICGERFRGSEAAMSGHVDLCLSRGLNEKVKKKRKAASSGATTGAKRLKTLDLMWQ